MFYVIKHAHYCSHFFTQLANSFTINEKVFNTLAILCRSLGAPEWLKPSTYGGQQGSDLDNLGMGPGNITNHQAAANTLTKSEKTSKLSFVLDKMSHKRDISGKSRNSRDLQMQI